jgi:hypothetical protein
MEDGTTIKIQTENYVLLRTPILEEKNYETTKSYLKSRCLTGWPKKALKQGKKGKCIPKIMQQ